MRVGERSSENGSLNVLGKKILGRLDKRFNEDCGNLKQPSHGRQYSNPEPPSRRLFLIVPSPAFNHSLISSVSCLVSSDVEV